MSGIFKYTPNRTASSTPNRRSALGTTGFGSPGLHHDATMDNSYSMGFRSPSINALTGHGSPVQVRSLRDNEEEISTLRKENFNLKLRIYFLEVKAGIITERDTPGGLGATSTTSSNTSGDGNYLKQNLDLKVEVESLRQDLQEKQNLLCQAAKAIEVLEEGHRKADEAHREMVNDLNNRIEMHQLEIKSLEKMAGELQQQHRELQLSTSGRLGQQEADTAGGPVRENAGESLLDFLDAVQQHSELSVQDKLRVLEMDNVVRQNQERIEELCRQVEQLQAGIDERTAAFSRLEVEVSELRFENAELREEHEKQQQTEAEVERLKKQIFDVRSELAEKLCVLDDTELKLEQKTADYVKSCKLLEKLATKIAEQDKDMAKLKRNSNISLPSEHGTTGSLHESIEIVDQDRKLVSQTEYDALVQRVKLLQQKNDTLIHKLCGGGNGDHRNDLNTIIKQLNDEVTQAREETEKAHRARKEHADLCAISTLRLEELAGFLDSLLRNKELVGTVSMDRRKAIRKAVDWSLDLSRSLNMSISVREFSFGGNKSLAQLSCLSGYLEHSSLGDGTMSVGGQRTSEDVENNECNKENRVANVARADNVTHGGGGAGANQTKQMIETLRAENKALRGELMQQQHRGKRRESKERKSVPIEPISDSEAWSEPDRGVSLARIGLEDSSALRQKHSSGPTAATQTSAGLLELSSTSDNESALAGMGLQRKSVSAAEIKQLQDALREKEGTILTIQSQLVDLDSELQRERMRNASIESEASENRHQSERWQRQAKDTAERLQQLEQDIHQRDAQIEKLRKDREQAAVDLRVAVMKLETMRTEYGELQQRHKRELDGLLAREQQQLDELRNTLTESFRHEQELKQQSFDTALAQNYISKNIHQEMVREANELHYRMEDAHNTISTMAQEQEQLRQQLAARERTVQEMQKHLDEATLAASKAAVERTKALNEKRQLESELGRVRDECDQLKVEKNALNERLKAIAAGGAHSASTTDEELAGGGGGGSGNGSRRRLENSSPDLGIESDPGRLSNVEMKTSPQRPLLKTLELTKSMSNLLLNPAQEDKSEDVESEQQQQRQSVDATTASVKHDCAKVDAELAELKRTYKQTHRYLSQAYDHIRSSNKRKEQIEMDIKQQIHKTHDVLKTVHKNIDRSSGGSSAGTSSTGGRTTTNRKEQS
uniref:Centrosomin N-terminal motif 1 domain-containing protein n=1 Tax=Anopheles dirus TaxID=7168 RepID=A0A182NFG9_9DIPT